MARQSGHDTQGTQARTRWTRREAGVLPAALLAGCAPGTSAPADGERPAAGAATSAGSGAATPGAATRSGGHITEGGALEIQGLNPVLNTTAAGQARLMPLLFSSLVTLVPPDGRPRGDLAESWTVSNDGLTYAFQLRKGVTFHDGRPLTAEDVKFTFASILDPAVGSPHRARVELALGGPDAITVRGPETIEFRLKQPNAPFLTQELTRHIVPKHVLGGLAAKDWLSADFNTKGPIGSGPFKFGEWVKDSHATVNAYAGYFKGRPKIDQYVRKVLRDASVVAAQLKTGEIDMGGTEATLLADLQKSSHLNLKSYDTSNSVIFVFQLDTAKNDLVADAAVRQALMVGLDRKGIVDTLCFGTCSVADSMFSPISWARDTQGLPSYAFDPARARRLLDDAGWRLGSDGVRERGGKKLSFTLYSIAGSPALDAIAAIAQEQWRALGVRVALRPEEFTALGTRLRTSRDFEVVLFGANYPVDPDPTPFWTSGSHVAGFNYGGYANPAADRLIEEAAREGSIDKRKALYKELDRLLMADLPTGIVVFYKEHAVINKRVLNVDPNFYGWAYNAEQWAVSDGK